MSKAVGQENKGCAIVELCLGPMDLEESPSFPGVETVFFGYLGKPTGRTLAESRLGVGNR